MCRIPSGHGQSWPSTASYLILLLAGFLPFPVPPFIHEELQAAAISHHSRPQYALWGLDFQRPLPHYVSKKCSLSLFVSEYCCIPTPFMKFSVSLCRTIYLLSSVFSSFVGRFPSIHCHISGWISDNNSKVFAFFSNENSQIK